MKSSIEEPRELGGLLGVEQLVEQQVGAVGVLERPDAVELAVGGVEERAVALAAGVDVLVAEALDLLRLGAARPEHEQAGLVETARAARASDARRPVGRGAGEADEVGRQVAVVGAAALVGPVDELHEPVGDLAAAAAPGVVGLLREQPHACDRRGAC